MTSVRSYRVSSTNWSVNGKIAEVRTSPKMEGNPTSQEFTVHAVPGVLFSEPLQEKKGVRASDEASTSVVRIPDDLGFCLGKRLFEAARARSDAQTQFGY